MIAVACARYTQANAAADDWAAGDERAAADERTDDRASEADERAVAAVVEVLLAAVVEVLMVAVAAVVEVLLAAVVEVLMVAVAAVVEVLPERADERASAEVVEAEITSDSRRRATAPRSSRSALDLSSQPQDP
jgi:hypothetical protein